MAEQDSGKKKGGKLRTLVIVILAVILAVGLSVAGTLWFLGSSGEGGGNSGDDQAESHTPASYFELEDPLVVPVTADQQRYLQVHLAFAMREHDVSSALERHLPTIRSRLRGVLQEKSFKQLQTRDGKEELLGDMRDAVNSALEAEGEDSIERVLFTNFVMQ
ncbi:MAG: flagellar basal body-associated FliL family protein [Pseudomonadota bacterium]